MPRRNKKIGVGIIVELLGKCRNEFFKNCNKSLWKRSCIRLSLSVGNLLEQGFRDLLAHGALLNIKLFRGAPVRYRNLRYPTIPTKIMKEGLCRLHLSIFYLNKNGVWMSRVGLITGQRIWIITFTVAFVQDTDVFWLWICVEKSSKLSHNRRKQICHFL